MPRAQAQELAPDVLVKNVTTEVVELITKDKEIRSGNRAKLIQVIEAKVLPHFNFSSMTALAMGQNWSKATPEQKKRLVEEFRTLLVRTYASALAAYSEQKLRFPAAAREAHRHRRGGERARDPARRAAGADRLQHGEDRCGLEGLRRDGGWREPRRQLPHRVQLTVREVGIEGLIKNLQAKNRSLAAAPPAEKK